MFDNALAEQIVIALFRHALGWESLNVLHETLGPGGMLRQTSGVFCRSRSRSAL
jgi:hypothetical protein